jgi:alkylation response protein AidB-like acyl-CoA dehydrogenase
MRDVRYGDPSEAVGGQPDEGDAGQMNLDYTDDEAALRDTVRELFEKESPVSVVRAAEPLGFDVMLWRKVVEMGLCAIGVPDEHGGGGAGLTELAIVAEGAGRYLAPVPFIEAAVANNLLVSSCGGDGGRVESIVSRAVAGELLATVAVQPAIGEVARLVPAGAVADVVVVLRDDELLLVRQGDRSPERPGGAVANLGAMPIGDCRLDNGESLVLARGPKAVAAHNRAVRQWQALTAAALVGLGFKALDIGVEYVMQRRAFGVVIANFQTIQHRLADDVTALDGARLLTYEAAWAADKDLPVAKLLATMAFLFASEAAFKTASESLHFHGGYGYTLEYDIQLYFRRAKAWPLVSGDPRAEHVALSHRLIEQEGT